MSKLITKTLQRAGKGLIESSGISCPVEVCRLAGRSSYTVLVDGVDKGVSRATASQMWQWVLEYFDVW